MLSELATGKESFICLLMFVSIGWTLDQDKNELQIGDQWQYLPKSCLSV
jgi:hypothetical protein